MTQRFTNLNLGTSVVGSLMVASFMTFPFLRRLQNQTYPIYYSLSRKEEVEADGVSALLIAKHNQSCDPTHLIKDTAFFQLWQQRFREALGSDNLKDRPDLQKPRLSATHPTDLQRTNIAHRATLMLRHHPTIMTNLAKRALFFAELQIDRPANDPEFMKQWHISKEATTVKSFHKNCKRPRRPSLFTRIKSLFTRVCQPA